MTGENNCKNSGVSAIGTGQCSETVIPVLESMLIDCVSALQPGVEIESVEAARVSKLIYDSMSTSGRVYHAMQHVFDISANMKDPILLLSALFHDVIYYSIDKEFSAEQKSRLEDVLQSETQPLALVEDINDELVEKVVRLYGFTPGAELPKSGTNEFLSGVIGVRVLSKWLPTTQLLQIAACIEATIPFRPTVDGKSPMHRLYDRLKAVCPEQSEEWLVNTVQKAAATANFDLCSFDSSDLDFFLDSSWKLIPEARPILMREDCPLIEWLNELAALQGRTKFLMGVVPRIFQSFRDCPSTSEMAEKERKTTENLHLVEKYAKVRQLQAMVLVGVVEAMGEDPASFPLRSCLSMDIPGLSSFDDDKLPADEQVIRNWLVAGRSTAFSWDPAASPLGAYLFDTLGMEGINEAVEVGKNQKQGSHDLLKFLPTSIVVTVSSRFGAIFTDQADLFHGVPEKLGIMAQ